VCCATSLPFLPVCTQVIVIDVLRRAGADVIVASVEDELTVTCSRGVRLVADRRIDDCTSESWDLIALPGGMPGAERLRDSAPLTKLVVQQQAAGKLHAAICATPAVAFEPQGTLGPYLAGGKERQGLAVCMRCAWRLHAAARLP
jgi:4-methyl-5(b-hydroxyethyl)-thiazole monophosphate biosynthesis